MTLIINQSRTLSYQAILFSDFILIRYFEKGIYVCIRDSLISIQQIAIKVELRNHHMKQRFIFLQVLPCNPSIKSLLNFFYMVACRRHKKKSPIIRKVTEHHIPESFIILNYQIRNMLERPYRFFTPVVSRSVFKYLKVFSHIKNKQRPSRKILKSFILLALNRSFSLTLQSKVCNEKTDQYRTQSPEYLKPSRKHFPLLTYQPIPHIFLMICMKAISIMTLTEHSINKPTKAWASR